MHHADVVMTPAPDVEVLVHAEAAEVEGLAVDQEAGAVHAHRPDADRLVIAVDQFVAVHDVDLQVVEVAAAGPPQLGVGHP